MPELVAQRFAPLGCGSLVIPLQCASQVPQMFGGIKEVEHFNGSRPAILCYLPNPRCAITHHQFVLSSAQAMEQNLPWSRRPNFTGSPYASRRRFCRRCPCDPRRAGSLRLRIIHVRLPFVPFLTVFFRPQLGPRWRTYQPSSISTPVFVGAAGRFLRGAGFLVELAAVLRHGFQVIRSRNGAPNC
jgi:hypothetical protein